MRHLARRLAPLAMAALLPAPAAAGATLTLDDALFGAAECAARADQDLGLTWTFSDVSGAAELEILGSSDTGCPAASADAGIGTDVLQGGLTASTSGTYPGAGDAGLTLGAVMGAAGLGAAACSGEDTAVYVCARTLDSGGAALATASARIRLQVAAPPAPASVAVSPGEGALHVSWAAGTATDATPASSESYRVFATAGGVSVVSDSTTATSLRLAGLVTGTTYAVTVVAYSEAGNPGAASAAVEGTPQEVTDYWEAYQAAGGREAGGCAAGDAGPAALLALAALAALRRRGAR